MTHASNPAPRKGILSGSFWVDTLERTVSTAAGSAIAVLVTYGGLSDVDWGRAASIIGLATLVSFLKAITASSVGDGSASLVK